MNDKGRLRDPVAGIAADRRKRAAEIAMEIRRKPETKLKEVCQLVNSIHFFKGQKSCSVERHFKVSNLKYIESTVDLPARKVEYFSVDS